MEAQREWTSGLFDCFEETNVCCCVLWCAPCAYGQTMGMYSTGREQSGCGDSISCLLLIVAGLFRAPFLLTFQSRTRIRERYQLQEAPCHDCLVHLFCLPCALCQEYKEVRAQSGITHRQELDPPVVVAAV